MPPPKKLGQKAKSNHLGDSNEPPKSLLREVTYWTLYLHSCVTVCSPEHHDKYHEYKTYEHHQYVEMPPETKQRCTKM